MGWWKSRRLRFLASSVVALFALFVVMRAVFFAFFSEVGDTVQADSGDLYHALGVGLRFDLRLALLMVLPLAVLAWLPRFNLVRSAPVRVLGLVRVGMGVGA